MPVTIRDVAEKVGRSITTVSRALNDYEDVSKSTRELIKKTALEMGYQPNSIAQQLRKQRTDTLGLILPTFGPRFSDPFFSEFLAGVGNTAAKYGFDLLVATRSPGEEELDAYRKNIQSRRVDGFIIVRTRRDDARISLLQTHNYPFSVFGRTAENNAFPLVDEDSGLGMEMVISHLAEKGHRRIAFIAAPQDLKFAHARSEGFMQAMEKFKLPIIRELMEEGDLTQRAGNKAAKRLLNLPQKPTAIVASNDLMAIGALSAAHDLGVVVGKELALTGFDDIPWAMNTHPTLTTVHQPIYEIGSMVTNMLINKITGKFFESPVILEPKLIIRQSSDFDIEPKNNSIESTR